MLISYLNIQTCACQLILIHVDKILELEMADFLRLKIHLSKNRHQYFGFCALHFITCGMCKVCILIAPSICRCVFMLLIDYITFVS